MCPESIFLASFELIQIHATIISAIFDYDRPVDPDSDWNYKGFSEWEFLDTYITAVIDSGGNEIVTSLLLGAELFSNQVQPDCWPNLWIWMLIIKSLHSMV